MTATTTHPRRFYTLKAFQAQEDGEAFGAAWLGRRAEVPGTDLPADFPARAEVLAAGYAALEDLQDVTVDELVRRGLRRRWARAVIAALET